MRKILSVCLLLSSWAIFSNSAVIYASNSIDVTYLNCMNPNTGNIFDFQVNFDDRLTSMPGAEKLHLSYKSKPGHSSQLFQQELQLESPVLGIQQGNQTIEFNANSKQAKLQIKLVANYSPRGPSATYPAIFSLQLGASEHRFGAYCKVFGNLRLSDLNGQVEPQENLSCATPFVAADPGSGSSEEPGTPGMDSLPVTLENGIVKIGDMFDPSLGHTVEKLAFMEKGIVINSYLGMGIAMTTIESPSLSNKKSMAGYVFRAHRRLEGFNSIPSFESRLNCY